MSKRLQATGWALAIAAGLSYATVAQAQATRTWVSGVGDDANPCSRTAPCKTWAGAISKTARGGEINALDPGGYGAVTITKSITLNGTSGAGYGSINSAGSPSGININIVDPADTKRTVRLNWIEINGLSTGTHGVRILNGTLAGTAVHIENTVIDGVTNRGIFDERRSAGKLFVVNTTIRNAGGPAINVDPAGARVDVLLENVRAHNSNIGFSAGSGTRAMIIRSSFSGNTDSGIYAEASVADTEVKVTSSVLSSNGTGITRGAGNVVIRVGDSDIALNGTAYSGVVRTYGNNRVAGSVGTAPTLIPHE